MTRQDKSVISYISTMTDFSDVDLRVEEHNGLKYLVAYVDMYKLNPSHPNYDKDYTEKITHDKYRDNHPIPGLVGSKASISTRLNEAKKFFGEDLKYEIAFLPKNYEYLDKNNKEIENAVKQIEPEIEVETSWDSDFPKPTLTFYCGNVKKYEEILKNYTPGIQGFYKEIQNILGDRIKLSMYVKNTRTSPKPN